MDNTRHHNTNTTTSQHQHNADNTNTNTIKNGGEDAPVRAGPPNLVGCWPKNHNNDHCYSAWCNQKDGNKEQNMQQPPCVLSNVVKQTTEKKLFRHIFHVVTKAIHHTTTTE